MTPTSFRKAAETCIVISKILVSNTSYKAEDVFDCAYKLGLDSGVIPIRFENFSMLLYEALPARGNSE